MALTLYPIFRKGINMSYAKVPSAFVVLAEPTNGRLSSVHGFGDTVAHARDMVNAICACQIGTVDREGDIGAAGTAATPSGTTGMFTDVIITMKKGSQKRSLRINNFDISKTANGAVVATDADVVALVAAFYDENNETGYGYDKGIVVD
jgi:hypothetical protein